MKCDQSKNFDNDVMVYIQLKEHTISDVKKKTASIVMKKQLTLLTV
jgi:hypothetical protein